MKYITLLLLLAGVIAVQAQSTTHTVHCNYAKNVVNGDLFSYACSFEIGPGTITWAQPSMTHTFTILGASGAFPQTDGTVAYEVDLQGQHGTITVTLSGASRRLVLNIDPVAGSDRTHFEFTIDSITP